MIHMSPMSRAEHVSLNLGHISIQTSDQLLSGQWKINDEARAQLQSSSLNASLHMGNRVTLIPGLLQWVYRIVIPL